MATLVAPFAGILGLRDHLALGLCYVGLRRALGYVAKSEEKLLKDFVRFAHKTVRPAAGGQIFLTSFFGGEL
jgi:hypothetical protein